VTKLRAAGRTGRAGKQGTAITFLSNDDDEVMCVVSSFHHREAKLTHFLVLARYDLKQGELISIFLGVLASTKACKSEISKSPVSKVPVELARHEAAQHKVSREMKRKRDAEDQG
jgi:ATP-dependent RNA helicase DDX23/PRP28